MPANCPLCSSAQTTLLTSKVRFNKTAEVRQCERCTLTFLNQSSFKFPTDFYESNYHQTYLTHVEPDALDPEKYYKKMLQATKPWSDRMNRLLTGREGCSTGHFITNIQSRARKVYGHELSTKEVQFCRDHLGQEVSDQPLQQRFEKGTFDYITMIFVLEHIAEPVEFLQHLKKFLKPDGKFVVLVPNVQDALVNFYDIPSFAEFYYCIEHLFYYTPKTITDMFAKAGLRGKVETVQEYPITNHLNWGYRQKPSDTLASRRAVPDIPLRQEHLQARWEAFWLEVDQRYKQLLGEIGYSDRIWAEVGSAND